MVVTPCILLPDYCSRQRFPSLPRQLYDKHRFVNYLQGVLTALHCHRIQVIFLVSNPDLGGGGVRRVL